MEQNRVVTLGILLVILAISAWGITSVSVSSPVLGQNVSGNLVLDVSTNLSDVTIDFNATNATVYFVNASGSFVYNLSILNDSFIPDGDGNSNHSFNVTFDTTVLADGVYNITANVTNVTDHSVINDSITLVTVDNTVPVVTEPSHIKGTSGWGFFAGDSDDYFSNESSNNILNFSLNITDVGTDVVNLTLDATDPCGNDAVAGSLKNGLWYASCTVNGTDAASFSIHEVNATVCDTVNNCNTTLFRNITLYNATVPAPVNGTVEFGSSTTNLATVSDLNRVAYVLDVQWNGSLFPTTPWNDSQATALISFDFINFTGAKVQADLVNLSSAVEVVAGSKNSYIPSRVFINSSAFTALNTSANVTLYNVPFTSVPTVVSDVDAVGGASVISFSPSGDGTGNLTFSVDGFSGYNGTDNVTPIITVVSPSGNGSSLVLNVSFNGTGTSINNDSLNLNLTNASGTIFPYTYSNLSCSFDGNHNEEILDCNVTTLGLAEGAYNLTIFAEDFGIANDGQNGTNATALVNEVFLDTTSPAVQSIAVSGVGSTSADLTVAATDTGSAISVCNFTGAGVGDLTVSGNSYTSPLSALSAETTYTLVITCADSAGNKQTNTSSFTTANAAASSSSSGGGSATGAKAGVETQVKGQFARKVWTSINKGETASLDVDNGVIGVTRLQFKLKKSTYGAWVKIAHHPSLPSGIAEFTVGELYKTIEITSHNVEKNLEGPVLVQFKVAKSWLAEMGLIPDGVALYRQVDGVWVPLETARGEESELYYHYTSQTPGFSYFVVGVSSDAVEQAALVTESAIVTLGDQEEVVETSAVDQDVTEVSSRGGMGWLGVLVVLLIVMVGLWYLYRRGFLARALDSFIAPAEKQKETSKKRKKKR